jgi:predicted peptidase
MLTHAGKWQYVGADSSRVVFAGHSMGGHGGWHVATHFPDLALAVTTAAGWFRKEYTLLLTYADVC